MRARKTLNKPLLRKLALKLRRLRHEEHYDQGAWIDKTQCGTAACLAGHVALLSGWKPIFLDGWNEAIQCKQGRREGFISEVAAEALGIPRGHWLFSSEPHEFWPDAYADRWRAVVFNSGKERPSRIAADLLDAIADGKVTL